MRSLNTKIIAQASLVLVIVVGTGFLVFAGLTQPIETVDIPEEIEDKLASNLIEILATTPIDQEVDVIVGCTEPGYLNLTQEVIGNFTLLKDWTGPMIFHAMLFPPQIVELASQDFVWRIDFNGEGNVLD